ncbi:hypothetical protein TgHK011_008462 [Trichoderma gracile]|nr:hypothetical protein TgHK011_008462 [Trichoderma gracile]
MHLHQHLNPIVVNVPVQLPALLLTRALAWTQTGYVTLSLSLALSPLPLPLLSLHLHKCSTPNLSSPQSTLPDSHLDGFFSLACPSSPPLVAQRLDTAIDRHIASPPARAD